MGVKFTEDVIADIHQCQELSVVCPLGQLADQSSDALFVLTD